jgi:hypothetical protein
MAVLRNNDYIDRPKLHRQNHFRGQCVLASNTGAYINGEHILMAGGLGA